MPITWDQVAAFRSRRHHLHERAPRRQALQVVSDVCGLHAQVTSSAELTLWNRVEKLPPGFVSEALWKKRSLFKTWAMRGTLHLLPSAEFGIWQPALSTQYERFTKPSWTKAFGPTPDELEQLVAAVGEALDGRELLREELVTAVATTGSEHLAEELSNGFGGLLKPAAFIGRICHAPGEGQKVRFTNPASWLPAAKGDPLDPETAAEDAVRRFLRQQGPATRDELARWWGVQPAPAGRILKRLGDEVTEVDVAGTARYVLAGDLDDLENAEAVESVRLLPGFDQYVIAATRHCTELMPGDFKDAVYRAQGWISPVLFVDGKLAGIWDYERKGTRVAIKIEPFGGKRPKRVRAEAAAEAEGLAAFMGGGLDLSWS